MEGADDYVTKPFSARELLARVRVLGRRTPGGESLDEVTVDGAVIDLARMVVVRGEARTALTPREVGIVRWLFRHQDRVVSARRAARAGVRPARGPPDPRGRHGDRRAPQEARGRSGAAEADRLGQGCGLCVEARAVNTGRTWYAAGLLAAALAVLLVAWFASGWADVRARQRAAVALPQADADARGAALARELRTDLAQLLAREVDRPYFQYQNLMRDPRASGEVGVTPSPLAGGTDDPLILGYFQLDASGRATTPTINDDVPALSEPTQLAAHQRFRDRGRQEPRRRARRRARAARHRGRADRRDHRRRGSTRSTRAATRRTGTRTRSTGSTSTASRPGRRGPIRRRPPRDR